MNAENFEKWLSDSLLPNLEEPSIVILDNASYHTRAVDRWPTSSWKKSELQEWLRSKNIPYQPTDTVAVLRAKITQYPRQNKSYVVDNLIMAAGHEVLRLPPYHCQYNAIEMVWSQAKRHYDKYISHTKNPLECWKAALDNVSQENWSDYVNHTDKIIKKSWDQEKVIITNQQPLIINVDSGSESFSESDSSFS